jgi:RimJ/RimL family protein N-acetyltransferase
MSSYKVLNKQVFSNGNYSIVPIRMEDRFNIMKWRNEQIYHLRQDKPLTVEDQDYYFHNVIEKLFKEDQPNQILFSFLENNNCVGYGGLVHINWVDKNAEISFVMSTELEHLYFEKYWNTFLDLIERISCDQINFHKLYVFAFDLRPNLYLALEKSNYFLDARLQDHCYYKNKFIDVIIYSKILND